MQLMTFNSLLMFDIVFVFFLFLVGVTCLVYYLPTGKPHTPTTINCRHHREHFYHSHHHHHHHRQHHLLSNQEEQELDDLHELPLEHQLHQEEDDEDEDDIHHQCCQGIHRHCHQVALLNQVSNHKVSYHEHNQNHDEQQHLDQEDQQQDQDHDQDPEQPIYPCSLTDCDMYCTRINIPSTTTVLASTAAASSLNRNLDKHRINSDRYFDESDDSDDTLTCSGLSAGSGVSGSRFNALGATFTEHFVIVNETERPLMPPPHCCYVKAKLSDIKECTGPIDDV